MKYKDVAWRQVEEYVAHQKEVKEVEDQKQNTKGEKKEHEQKN